MENFKAEASFKKSEFQFLGSENVYRKQSHSCAACDTMIHQCPTSAGKAMIHPMIRSDGTLRDRALCFLTVKNRFGLGYLSSIPMVIIDSVAGVLVVISNVSLYFTYICPV